MNSPTPSDGLVLGTLALQLNLITSDQLAEVLAQWFSDRSITPGELLVQRGHLTAGDHRALQSLAANHLTLPLEAMAENLRASREFASHTIRESSLSVRTDASLSLLRTLRDRTRSGDSPAQFSALTELNSSNQRFKLLRPHAVGGLGMVSVAHDSELDREVAIKEMRLDSPSDDAIGRFLMEARLTGQLDHPGIPPVYALGYFEDGRPFYAMRLIDGVTLKEAVADFHRRFPPPDQSRERSLQLRKLLGAFVSVCHTLRYAHSRNVLHRDIKPSNVMLGGFGETLVLDWGLAKSKEQSMPYSTFDAKAHQSKRRSEDPTLTGTGSVMGTPHYMSPEQARGEWESVNLRSEVYSLGATLYTLLTGKLPFNGTTRDAVLEQVRRGEFKAPRLVDARIPPELDAICAKAMALEREDRFATAGEIATEIEHWLADEPTHCYREPAGRRWQRWVKSHQSAVAALLALLVTGMLALGLGAVAVSLEHRLAKREEAQALVQRERAERSETAAHEFVGRFLTLTYNSQLENIPGSERPRLELMNSVMTQIESWVIENPDDSRRWLDLVTALRERAMLYVAVNQPDRAWSDLTRAIETIDKILVVPGESQQWPFAVIRLHTIAQLGQLTALKYGTASGIEFYQLHQIEAQKKFQQNAGDPRSRLALAIINMDYAQLLFDAGRVVEASELTDAAVTQCELLRMELADEQLSNQLVGGVKMATHLACIGRSLQTQIATELGDLSFASQCAQRAHELCDAALMDAPDATGPLTVKLRVLGRQIGLNRNLLQPKAALRQARLAVEAAQQIVERFPGNQTFARLSALILLQCAEQELECGTVTRAGSAACWSMELLSKHSHVSAASNESRLALASAHRLSGEIALIEGNVPAAAAHCHAARTLLAQCDHPGSDDELLWLESQCIALVEMQIE